LEDGTPIPTATPVTETEYAYDSAGRVNEEAWPDFAISTTYVRQWDYDAAGRVVRSHSEFCPRRPGFTYTFEYDSSSRVIAQTLSTDGEVTRERTEITYGDAGDVLITRDLICGATRLPCSMILCVYDSDRKLASRHTLNLQIGPRTGRTGAERIDETFDGIDRPRTLTLRDLGGRTLSQTHWTYENDSRGNWIMKTANGDDRTTGPSVLRRIEYQD